ncbi:MAG: TolC family protein, partial [Geopsychrobacter sp.]|nr:TolC family protein [Geopsychrobacter sp.]
MLKLKFKSLAFILLLILISGCTLGPDYEKPAALVPIQYKNDAPWKIATPSDHQDRGEWWKIYADETLNELEQQAAEKNQTLKAAYARMTQAQAGVGINKADRLPRLDTTSTAQRSRF